MSIQDFTSDYWTQAGEGTLFPEVAEQTGGYVNTNAPHATFDLTDSFTMDVTVLGVGWKTKW